MEERSSKIGGSGGGGVYGRERIVKGVEVARAATLGDGLSFSVREYRRAFEPR